MGTVEKRVDENIERLQAQLVEWGAKIDELASKAAKAGAEARTAYHKGLEDLRVKRSAAQVKLDELKSAGSEKWDTFRAGIEKTWNDLEVAFKDLTQRSGKEA
jgi:hypothetical protein